ncbi:hypothetical protein [Microbacterium sp. NPDC056052]|uniref:hypothetical protein n=1 Tax=Microbacterium sp. NPDC056052 TaxID=3345695 RepID=UPI0035D9E959
MTTDPDDALRWEGDEPDAPDASAKNEAPAAPDAQTSVDPAPEVEPAAQSTAETHAAEHVATAGTTPAAEAEADADDEPAGIGNAALVFYGIIGGVYLLFAVGWIVGGFRLRLAAILLGDWMYFPWMWLAALAPVLWFAAAWVLTRGSATWIRIVALIAGAVLLVPWPFVMVGTVGA